MTGIPCSRRGIPVHAGRGRYQVRQTATPIPEPGIAMRRTLRSQHQREACLDRMILFGEDSLRTAVREFTVHYHNERNHQGIGNVLIFPANSRTGRAGPVRRRSRLGGMLNYYERSA